MSATQKRTMSTRISHFVFAARLDDVRDAGCTRAQVDGHTLALFDYGGKVYAVDSRCPTWDFL